MPLETVYGALYLLLLRNAYIRFVSRLPEPLHVVLQVKRIAKEEKLRAQREKAEAAEKERREKEEAEQRAKEEQERIAREEKVVIYWRIPEQYFFNTTLRV